MYSNHSNFEKASNMINQILLTTLFISIFAAPQLSTLPELDGRIVGGEPVDIEDYPYQVQLLFYGGHICGGSIISERYVVTAAHCTEGSAASELSIRTASSIRNSGGIVVQVATLHQHPLYDNSTKDYDISVLELAEDLAFQAGTAAIKLPSQDQILPIGEMSVVTGWGKLSENGTSYPAQLQAVKVPIISQEECGDAYAPRKITDMMMCAGYPQGEKDACQGDSGGPLVVEGELIGIVSWGYGCADPDYPGVYASVPGLRSYIKETSGI